MEGSRRESRGSESRQNASHSMTGSEAFSPRASNTPSDATQRVRIDPTGSPVQRQASAAPRRPAPSAAANSGTSRTPRKKPSRMPKKQRTTIITLCAIAAVLLIAIIVACAIMFSAPEDDGLILNNVYAAGVNLGGKTPEEAKALLQDATADTYSKLDMLVEVHTSEVTLSPAKTGADLDVDAVVEAAYNYGRTGSRADRQKAKNQSLTTPYYISILPYLNLDTRYIQEVVDELGNTYSSTLSQPSYRVEGALPDLEMDSEDIDFEMAYQTLYITIGTPEYGLNTGALYDQIMEAYNSNIFQVVGNISVESPEVLDLEALRSELCVDPVDAVLDDFTYEVTPEKNGYGFQIEEVRTLMEEADYGDTIRIPLRFIRPSLTEAELTDGLFETMLASCSMPASIDKDLLINLKLVCRAINSQKDGMILKADEVFSFNEIVGMPTEAKGYKEVMTYAGKTAQKVMGGGISQVASALYYSALKADLEILERTSHAYAPNFIEAGLDADISYGSMDLKFENTTGRPIRIKAEVTDAGELVIEIWGTANKDYSVDIVYETLETYEPKTLVNIMIPDNMDGYLDGDILVQPITGYDICTYKFYRYTDTTIESVKKLIAFSHYDQLDEVVVEIQDPSVSLPTDPSSPADPSAPSNPTDPSTPNGDNTEDPFAGSEE